MTDKTKKEPTTAYMFATVRRELESRAREACGIAGYGERAQRSVEDLAQLERRMGAMERAARPLLKLVRGECGPVGRAMADALDAALTDAPPVFTLKEVHAIIDKAVDATRDHIISALRSTGGGR